MPPALLAYTFGQGLAFAALVTFLVAWGFAVLSVVRRGDLGVLGKGLWIVAMLVIPLFGLLAYYLWQAATPDRSR
ncbi:MAG: PLDc N-terminal domain-containing protein [Gaiellaceae bacterium]